MCKAIDAYRMPEDQKGEITCPGSHSYSGVKAEPEAFRVGEDLREGHNLT